MRFPRFRPPEGPGFRIAADYYLAILCSRATLPAPREIVSPKGPGPQGFLAPLDGSDKTALERPLRRGIWALSDLPRKTVLKTMIMAADEPGFQPADYARSAEAMGAGPEAVARLRGAWWLIQFTVVSHDPDVYPALDFVLDCAGRLAELGEGVVADPLAERYRMPGEVRRVPRLDPKVDAREHVGLRRDAGGAPGLVHLSTRGLRKFEHPELEIQDVDEEAAEAGARMLMAIAQAVLLGRAVRDGERYGASRREFEVRPGGLDRRRWEGIPALELLPPTGRSAGDALRAWVDDGEP